MSVATPAVASARTRTPTPAGKRNAGRSAKCRRAAGMSGVATNAATPAVVPAASTTQAKTGTGRAMSW